MALMPDVFPVLEAGGFVLREIVAADAAAWHGYLSDIETIEWTSTPIMDEGEVAAMMGFFRERFADKSGIRWALSEGRGGVMAGDCGYNASTHATGAARSATSSRRGCGGGGS